MDETDVALAEPPDSLYEGTAEVGITSPSKFADKVYTEQAMMNEDGELDPPDDYYNTPNNQVAQPDVNLAFRNVEATKLDGFAQYLAAQWEIGAQDVREGMAFSAAVAGARSVEDVEYAVQEGRKKSESLQKGVSMFESEHFWQPTPSATGGGKWRDDSAKWITNFIQGIPGVVMRNTAFGMTVGAGALTAAGAGALAGGGTPVSLPLGVTAAGIGAFNISGQLMSGMALRDMTRKGIPVNKARPLAITSGILQAVLETCQVMKLFSLGKKSFTHALNEEAVKLSIQGTVLRFGKDVGINATQEWSQEWVQISTEFVGQLKDGELRMPTKQEWIDATTRAGQAFVEGARGGAGSIAATKVGTTVAVKTWKGAEKVFGKAEDKSANATQATAVTEELKEVQKPGSTEEKQPLQGSVEKTVEAAPESSRSTELARERHEAAKETTIKARQHLETVLYEIEQVDPDDDGKITIPQDLVQKRKDAHKDVKNAIAKEKVAALQLAKMEAQDVLDSKELTPEQVTKAREAVDEIAEKEQQAKDAITKDAKSEVRKQLTAQIEQLNKEFQKADANKDPEGVQNISKVLNDAEWRLKLLDSGLLSTKLEAQLVNSERNSLLKRGVAELAQKAFAKVWQIAKTSSNIAKEQGLKDRELISTLIKKSGLTQAEQGQMLTFLKTGVLTKGTIEKLDRRIASIIAKRERKIAKDKLADTISGTKEVVVPRGFKAEAKARADALLGAYKRIGNLKPEEVEQLISDLEKDSKTEESRNAPIAAPDTITPFMELAIANDIAVANDKNSTAEDINAITERLQGLIETGKAEQFEVEEARKARDAEAVAVVQFAMRGPRRKQKILANMSRLEQEIVKLKRIGFTQGMFNIWSTHVATLMQHATDKNYKAMREMLSLDKEGRQRRANTSRFINTMFDHLLIKEGESKRNDKLKQVIVRGAKRQKREGFREPISDNELIQLRLQCQDETLASRIQATYHMEQDELLAHVESFLSQDQLYLADRLKSFYQEYYKRINEHHIKVFGYSLKNNKQYSGRAIGANTGNSAYSDFLLALEHNRSASPASVKARLPNQNDLAVTDAFGNAVQHIEDMESWRAMSEKLAMLEAVFNNKFVRRDIEDKFGKDYLELVQRTYQRVVGIQKIPHGRYDKMMGAIRGNYGMYMAGNLTQYLKQGTGLAIWLNYMSASELMTGLGDYIDNFEEANAKLKQTDFFQDRKYNVTPETRAALNNASNDLTGDKWTWTKFLLLPVSQTDSLVNSIGVWSMYKSELKKLAKDTSLTQEQREAEAMARAERAADESQSSAGEQQKTSFETEYGGMGQLISTLSKQNVQTSNLSTIEWRRMLSNPTPANIYKAFRTSLVLNNSQALFAAVGAASSLLMILATPYDDEEEKNKKIDEKMNNAITDYVDNMLVGSALGLPIIGQMGKALMTIAWDTAFKDLNKKWYKPDIPGIGAAFDMAELSEDIAKDSTSSVPPDALDYTNFYTDFMTSGAMLITPPQARAVLGLTPTIKTLAWANTNQAERKERKQMRRDEESYEPPPEPIAVPKPQEDSDDDGND